MRIGYSLALALAFVAGGGITSAGTSALAASKPAALSARASTTRASTARAGTARAGTLLAGRGVAGPAASRPAAASGPAAASAKRLCGTRAGRKPHIKKVMWIFMENTSYGTRKGQIPGNPSAKYIDRTLIRHCGSTSDYHAVTHPSFPNYLAATSGGLHGDGGLRNYKVRSIFSQVDPSWRSYQEFMPKRCDRSPQVGDPATGHFYVNRHNPAVFYSSEPVRGDCKKFDRSLGSTTSGAMLRAVKAGRLPRFSFVTPGLCNDMHKLPPGVKGCANPAAHGDAWLATWIPIITSGRDYRKGHLVIDIAWDEGSGGKLRAKCLHSSAVNCIVPDVVVSPYTRHKVSSTDFSHYSLLKMTEKLLRVHFLGHARDAGTRNLCRPFGLCPRH